MTPAERLILQEHHLQYVHIFPPCPATAIICTAKECGVTVERVMDILIEHGSLIYPGSLDLTNKSDRWVLGLLGDTFSDPLPLAERT